MSSPEHVPAHRGGRMGDVLSVTSGEFRRMQRDRASVERVLDLAAWLEGGVSSSIAAMIREAVAGPQ